MRVIAERMWLLIKRGIAALPVGLMVRNDKTFQLDKRSQIGGFCIRWHGEWHAFMFKRCPDTTQGKRYFVVK